MRRQVEMILKALLAASLAASLLVALLRPLSIQDAYTRRTAKLPEWPRRRPCRHGAPGLERWPASTAGGMDALDRWAAGKTPEDKQ